MCGTLGIVAFSTLAWHPDPGLLTRMRDTMTHRGPDGGGCWISEDKRAALGKPIFWSSAEAFFELPKHPLLSPALGRVLAGLSSWEEVLKPIHDNFMLKAWDTSHLDWMAYTDLSLRLPERLLMRVDKMSMGVSLEGRVPFLDHKFVELALSIPAGLKTKHNTLKYMLKKAVRGVIPDVLIDRPKQGFGVPVYEWFLNKLGMEIRRKMDEFCANTDFLDRKEVFRYLDIGDGPQAWYFTTLSYGTRDLWHNCTLSKWHGPAFTQPR